MAVRIKMREIGGLPISGATVFFIAFPCVFKAFSCTRGSWPYGWAARARQGARSFLAKRPRGRLSAGGRGNGWGLGAGLGLGCALSGNWVVCLGVAISQTALSFDLHGS